jgi:hypothetical protein
MNNLRVCNGLDGSIPTAPTKVHDFQRLIEAFGANKAFPTRLPVRGEAVQKLPCRSDRFTTFYNLLRCLDTLPLAGPYSPVLVR